MRIVLAANPEADQPWVADAAADLARQTGGSVAVVAVDEVEIERLAPAPRSVFTERAERAATAAAERLTAAGIEVAVTVVLPGRPLQRIMEFADDHGADLIVVGSSTRPRVAERLLGSLPLDLIKRSPRPVVVVTHPHRAG
ncbi:universal stress protein [Pseudosporangium ferrugineum]|uniref:Nucleotide-binding universal stress UspA family protein n=1 Tax=Pseudosporangium ferrugineum TaxID=439699 RepID=A0A2T0SHS0_9ACTN|nr:universal stress protein [Pseudosporangium ferrugineum]PRY32960.1 nucleotide-binding universal stress UspA family protein [Pseudosporangium ferrugineum]